MAPGLERSSDSFDPYKANAYSDAVKFDLDRLRGCHLNPAEFDNEDSDANDLIKYNPEISMKVSPPKHWELDVKGLVSTEKWLQNYGLKRNRLDMFHLLPTLGFKHSDDYDTKLKKPICSRYGNSLFKKYFHCDGRSYCLCCSKEQLSQIETRLMQAVSLYKRRLEWLTTESRRIFGVIQEKCVAVVLDICNMSPQRFDQYRTALDRVLQEQVSRLAKFNLIRASEDLTHYSERCVPVTCDSLADASSWLWDLGRCAAYSRTATCEAVMKAVADKQVDAVYLFSEGSAADGARELLKEKLTGSRVPVHVISYNCTEPSTIDFLKRLARMTGGRFHAYAVVMEMDSYERDDVSVPPRTNQANIILRKKTYGGVPPGAGMREDVMLLFEELEEARNNLAQIRALIDDYPAQQVKVSPERLLEIEDMSRSTETYMSSREWLLKFGLTAKKLGFYNILAGVAFRHQDGVVDMKVPPIDQNLQTDAVTTQKLVNAKYCDQFPHVRWKDGQVAHVQVTPEVHRNYEHRMNLALDVIQQRIDWLQQGSRELFGTVIEEQMYFLLDTSSSMAPHIQFVKDKMFVLMQEQLRHKQKFNLIAFNSRVDAWKDRLVDVTEKTLHHAWTWLKQLSCHGSTNTLAALRLALSDCHAQAIYLLTDGRPDQPPKSILAQLQLHPKIPVHTISFNCADKDANQFLCELARETKGRFHYYSENGIDPEGPEPWESEDIHLLRDEMMTGQRNLEKIALLRDECAALSWRATDGTTSRSCDSKIGSPTFHTATPSSDRHMQLSERNSPERPASAPGFRHTPTPQSVTPRPSTALGYYSRLTPRPETPMTSRSLSLTARSSSKLRPFFAAKERRPPKCLAGQTKTSILRSLGCREHMNDPEWMLPETRKLFDKQWARQERIRQASSEEKAGEVTPRGRKGRRPKKGSIVDGRTVMSSAKWLSTHGLAARKLTILDALAPTFIPHHPKYVRILGKKVEAKVFDDILPIAHVGGNQYHLVNPQGVNLQAYRSKVEAAIAGFNRRLDRIVWAALPENEKESFESDSPVSFVDNKTRLLQALEHCDWPVSQRDVILLETEVKQGEAYIQQARELEDAAMGKGLPRRRDDDDTEDTSDGTLRKGSKRRRKKRPKSPSKDPRSSLPRHKVKKSPEVLKGQRVIGRNKVDGFYYAGSVMRCPDSRHALVVFNDIGQQTIPTRFVVPISGAISRPPIQGRDYVLAKVINQDTGLECYVPGVVTMMPRDTHAQAKFYTVTMYTGQQAHFLRSFLVKINKLRYTFLIRYIADVSRKEEEEEGKYADSVNSGVAYDRSRTSSSSSSRSRSRSRSPARVISRSPSPEQKEKSRLEEWRHLLEKQKRKQKRKQKKLHKQAKELADLKKKLLENSGDTKDEDNTNREQLLHMILDEFGRKDRSQKKLKKGASRSSSVSLEGRGAPDMAPEQIPRITGDDDGDDVFGHLPSLSVGEEVLARWSDDGWYYRGTVRQDCSDGSFLVEDGAGCFEKIGREDIIADSDDAHIVIEPKDAVVALHPSYSFSYAPAVVLTVTPDHWVIVRCYDSSEAKLPRDEVFRIPPEKFQSDVSYIEATELDWVGQAVVARNDDTGTFHLGVIRQRIGNGRRYEVEWAAGSCSVQDSTFIFGPFTKCHPVTEGDRVLAIADQETLVYLPGRIISDGSGSSLIKFCDGSVSQQLDPVRCFWLSRDYYDKIASYYKNRQER